VTNVSSDDYNGIRSAGLSDVSVYCSYKRNNVNILFEHAQSPAPFELTRIVVKVNSMKLHLIVDAVIWIYLAGKRGTCIYLYVPNTI
jgi:hypothetical protein